MMKTRSLSFRKELELYVHIPFCIRKCLYCDFISGPGSDAVRRAYTEAVKKEIRSICVSGDYLVVSVFFGGGTPSVLPAEELCGILELIRKKFTLAEDAEITLEANPGTVDAGKLRKYLAAGFNRISLGCQSVHEEELKKLGRIHSFGEFCESFRLAREAGFSNINVDLMSGLPDQKTKDWETSLHTIARLNPEHISAYSLIVEPGTPFAEMDLNLPDEDTERLMYGRTREILSGYGYERYEISNYAKEGYACRHNIGYWTRREYIGFGIAAASLFEGERWTNTEVLPVYLSGSADAGRIRTNEERLSRSDAMEEFMFLGLRMTDGVAKDTFFREFQETMDSVYGAVLEKYQNLGFMVNDGKHAALTEDGISVSNRILADFLLE